MIQSLQNRKNLFAAELFSRVDHESLIAYEIFGSEGLWRRSTVERTPLRCGIQHCLDSTGWGLREGILAIQMLSLLAGICIAQQATPAKAPPPPDRTAEPQLHHLFKDAASIHSCHVVIRQQDRESAAVMTTAGNTIDLWYEEGPKFRAYYSSEWGANRYVCDGKTLMIDPLDDDDTIHLKDAGKSIYSSDASLGMDGDRIPLYYLLDGEKGFDALVSKTDPVILKTWPDKQQSIEFHSKDLGTVEVFYSTDGKLWLATRVQFYNMPWLTKMAAQDPDDFGPPDPTALSVVSIDYLSINEKSPAGCFEAIPPKGKKMEDARKKG